MRAPQKGTELKPVDAQKRTMQDLFARCLKKNTAEVCTLLNSVLIVKRNFNLLPILLQVLLRKLTSEKSQWLRCRCMRKLICNSKISSCPFPCPKMSCNNRCLFFRRLKINHESHEFILDSGTVANNCEDG
jgi:hypothetical protein